MQTKTSPIGEMLADIEIITSEQLAVVVEQERTTGKHIGQILLDLGYIDEEILMQAYEYYFRIVFYDLSKMDIPLDLSETVSQSIAKQYTVVPIYSDGTQLTIATADPLDFQAIDDVKLKSKMKILPVLATRKNILSKISLLYERIQTDAVMEKLNKEYTELDLVVDESMQDIAEDDIGNAPVVKLVNLLIDRAITARASDIHIEPMEDHVRVRFRIDGVMSEQLKITKAAHNTLVARLKIMSDMDIAEKRVPQDGRVQTTYNGQNIDLRLSVLPTVNGEKVVIRVLGGRSVTLDRKSLGFSEYNSKMFDEILRNPHGIILVSGPTGSGKTTTLYTILNELNKPSLNIITIEDPVEYRMPGINQIQINTKAGLTFASGLRSILRQDPDVIMVGEIRDGETAEIAVRASITGHLVLSTIHTNDSPSTITRLIDMGIESFLVSSAVVGVISQRLVRRICPDCKQVRELLPSEKRLMKLSEDSEVESYKGIGCKNCNNTGFKGRIAIHEVLVMDKKMRELVDKRATADQIRTVFTSSGGKTLRDSCIQLVLDGVTTVEELIKVAYNTD
ncbi:MAG: ATPase, T2SS/T4P/T4SS family [Oscillospiraceae bacterium]|nr:ATPase, T2SS/T4P/T4SS family [Oscillospiraceae bacterium]